MAVVPTVAPNVPGCGCVPPAIVHEADVERVDPTGPLKSPAVIAHGVLVAVAVATAVEDAVKVAKLEPLTDGRNDQENPLGVVSVGTVTFNVSTCASPGLSARLRGMTQLPPETVTDFDVTPPSRVESAETVGVLHVDHAPVTPVCVYALSGIGIVTCTPEQFDPTTAEQDTLTRYSQLLPEGWVAVELSTAVMPMVFVSPDAARAGDWGDVAMDPSRSPTITAVTSTSRGRRRARRKDPNGF